MSATADHAHDPAEHGGHDDHHDPNLAHHFDSMEQQFESGKLGMWVFLATEILMFGGLFCAYAIYRGNNPDVFLFAHKALDKNLGAINTAVLLASSFTMAVGVKAASQGRQKLLLWMLAITFAGGIGFMAIKTIEYKSKFDHGLYPGTWSAFYTDDRGFETSEAKAAAQGEATYYIEKKQEAGHGGGHGGGHTDGHGETHAGSHGEGEPDAHGAEPDTAHPAEAGDHAVPDEHPGDAGHADAATPEPQGALQAVDARAVWPPRPSDHMSLPAPVNSAAGVNEAYLGPSPQVDGLQGLASGPAKAQSAFTAGRKYPGFENLSPLDQERTHIFFQIYFVMTGLHGLHVLIGMGLIAWVFVAAIKSPFGPSYYAPVDIVGLYWHLVDLIWIFLFPLLYLIH